MHTLPCSTRRPAAAGFTLIETLVTMGILVLLLGLAAPNFRTMFNNQILTTTVNEYFSAINLTRARAIDTGGTVHLGPLDGNDWSKGWAVFINKSDDKNLNYDNGDTLIQMHDPVPEGITIESQMSDNTTKYIAYNGTGFSRTNGGVQQPLSGNITFRQGDQVRCIVVSFMGRPRVYKPASGVAQCNASS